MTDWNMLVETFPNGGHNFPRVTPRARSPPRAQADSPRRSGRCRRRADSSPTKITERRGAPSAAISSITLYRSDVFNDYRGRASFSNGTVSIQSYEPFRADMEFAVQDRRRQGVFDRIELASDGATSEVTGEVDLGHWPEQMYRVKSHIDFPTQKNIFFHRDRFTASGQGDFQGTFHLFKGGRELKGTFTSPVAGVNDWRFPNLAGRCCGCRDRLEITDARSELYGGTARFDYRMAPFGKKGCQPWRSGTLNTRDVDLGAAHGLSRDAGASGWRAARPGRIARMAGR